jgi:serine/threonine protein kinase
VFSHRYMIALGVGSAILYLHTECEQCVLHGDIKPANILLDPSRNAKLGDFGLARFVDHGRSDSSDTTQVVAGTPGYMDPELVSTQRPCAESDVYSFGVVLLEIACGRRPTTTTTTTQLNGSGPVLLLNWVRGLYRAESVLAAADRRLDGEFDDKQMRRVLVVGLWCAHHDLSQRPSIVQAMDLLRRQDLVLPLHVDLGMQGPEVARSLEEIAYGDFSEAEDSASGNPSTHTAYHTSTDSSCLPE